MNDNVRPSNQAAPTIPEMEGYILIAKMILMANTEMVIVRNMVGRIQVTIYPGDDLNLTWDRWKDLASREAQRSRATLDTHCEHTDLNAAKTRCLSCGQWMEAPPKTA